MSQINTMETLAQKLSAAQPEERRALIDGLSKAQLISICKALNVPHKNKTHIQLRNILISKNRYN